MLLTRQAPSRGSDLFDRAGMAVANVGASRSKSQLIDSLRYAAKVLGADKSYFACFIHDRKGFDSYRFLLACDPVWFYEYERNECHLSDPWLTYARQHSRPVPGRDIQVHGKERGTVDLARSYGFNSTLVIPAPVSGRLSRSGVLVLASESAAFPEAHSLTDVKILARSLALEVHDRLADLLREEKLRDYRLTPLELELLRFERDGLPTKAISRRLNASLESIDTRFRRLNAKLGVANRQESAHVAVEYGLI